ncbi:DUF6134 family protein [Gaetbulibacter saemankumensis]|uniref:DUF6134 family protein n=1 Tax=Gaetbulibacter saemankumensis TaxID=311208 RepID=UPI0003F617C5|nr:DUF6134 family protein [Gaetbulibacter saemankumensis]
MIPILILYLVRRIKRVSFFSRKLEDFKRLIWKLKLLLPLFVFNISFANNTDPNTHLIYNVVRNNHVIGTISVSRMFNEDSTAYHLESHINVKALFKFNITGKETTVYKDGILTYSSIYRKVNNKIKANHKVVFKGEKYHSQDHNNQEQIYFKEIHRNLVTLYFSEPVGVNQIYCDKEKRMVRIEPMGESAYKVSFSDGKYNVYHYRDGKCVKIEAISALFEVDLIPAES